MSAALTATQIVDMHTDLAQRFRLPIFRDFIAGSFTSFHNSLRPGQVRDRVAIEAAEWALNAHYRHIQSATLFRVTADMMTLLEHAQQVLDSTDSFDHSLAPTPAGMVRFDTPIACNELRGGVMRASWLIWGPATYVARNTDHPGKPVTLLAWYNDPFSDPDDFNLYNEVFRAERRASLQDRWPDMPLAKMREYDARLERDLGRWFWLGAEYLSDGSPLGEQNVEIPSWMKAQILAEGSELGETYTNLPRYAHALWLLLNQTITRTETEQPERPSYRRAVRMNLPGRVTTIKLRRMEGSHHEGESTVEWQHRWIVRGHWRWQPYGPGRKDHRRIWIHPYLKGPEDMPLIDRPKLYELDR